MPREMEGAQIIGKDCKFMQSFMSRYHALVKAKSISFKNKKLKLNVCHLKVKSLRKNKSTRPTFMKSQRSTWWKRRGRKKKERPRDMVFFGGEKCHMFNLF